MRVPSASLISKIALCGAFVALPVIVAAPGAGRPARPTATAPGPATPESANPGGAALGHATPPGPAPATEADLEAAIAPIKTIGHDVTMTTHDSRISGSVDPARHAASLVADAGDLHLAEVVDSGRVWLKMDLGDDANSQLGIEKNVWMTLDPAKLSTDNNLPIKVDGSDPIDLPGILAGVTTVRRVDAHHLAGTMDLNRVKGHNTPDPDAVRDAGAPAKSAPYALATDQSGRITNFTVDTRSFDPTLSVAVTYANYGAPSPIVDPVAATPAPDSVYSVFN